LNSPTVNSITNSTLVTFNATVSDNIAIANVSLYLNGVLNQTSFSGLNNTNYIFPLTIPNGVYTWNIKACDSSENCAFSSANRSLTINTSASDTTPPQIQFGSSTPADNSVLSQNFIPVSVTASDSSGIQSIVVHLYDSNNVLVDTQTSATSSFSLSFTNLASGTYYINATTIDNAGNINSTETRKIILTSGNNNNNPSSSGTGRTVNSYVDVYEQQYEAQLNQTNPQIDLGGQQTPAKTTGATLFLIITTILILGIGAAIFVLIRKRK
jgi:hypothetical protein